MIFVIPLLYYIMTRTSKSYRSKVVIQKNEIYKLHVGLIHIHTGAKSLMFYSKKAIYEKAT